jgi:(2Fe-2S) ferredoxin
VSHLKSLDELEKIRQRALEETRVRQAGHKTQITIGMGTCGIAAGARETMAAILAELGKRNLTDVVITQTGCVGLCEKEPLVDVTKPGKPKVTYGNVDAEKAKKIVAQHVINDQVVGEWVVATR